jgi:hypothetical protein
MMMSSNEVPSASQIPSNPAVIAPGPVAGSDAFRNPWGRGVGEEDHQPQHRLQDRRGDRERSQGMRAEVADHSGVGEQEDGFGDQCSEGRKCQTENVFVDRCHGPRF